MRKEKWCRAFCFLLYFVSALCLSNPSSAQSARSPLIGLAVNERGIRARFETNRLAIDLPIDNSQHKAISARVALELVEPSGDVPSRIARDAKLSPGLNQVKFALPTDFVAREKTAQLDLLYYRLRYSVQAASAPAASGIVSVGEVTSNAFELHVEQPWVAALGQNYTLHLRAIHPITGRPVAGVMVHASIDVDADDGKPLVSKTIATDREGFAALAFLMPPQVNGNNLDVEVVGRLGDFSTTADGEVFLDNEIRSSLSTDKTLYRPGQTLHMRLTMFGEDKKAAADQAATLTITDPDNTLVYREQVKTSKFGIASADWPIPGDLRLGSYQIEATDDNQRMRADAVAEISRYDLPAFEVTAAPDKSSYLPGQNAVIDVHADYVFGKPVRRGHVRVVHEADRKWNFRDQKWDIQEDGVWEGDTNDGGHYAASVDLSKDEQALADDDYQRFSDLNFAAYFTDASTGRTEQHRFTVRVTKDPIHIYLIGAGTQVSKIPSDFYVSTDYADGTPASCDVEIQTVPESDPHAGAQAVPPPRVLKHVRTNRYGVAKVSGLVLPPDMEGTNGMDYQDVEFIARDSKGATGRHSETIFEDENDYGADLETNKTLFRLSDPIDVSLATNAPDATFIVEALNDRKTIESKTVRVRGGQAAVEFLPNPAFQNRVDIIAYAVGAAANDSTFDSTIFAVRSVFFPKDDALKLDVKMAKPTYKPGEEATADLHITGADHTGQQGAIGLAVVDEALEQLEKTDSEFGRRGYMYGDYWRTDDDSSTIAGISERDLMKLDMDHPLPSGLDLVAEILLLNHSPEPKTFDSDSHPQGSLALFANEIDPQIKPIKSALDASQAKTGAYPINQSELDAVLKPAGSDLSATSDPWGTPYRAKFSVERDSYILQIESAGPDKTFGTADDFSVLQTTWQYFKKTADAISLAVNAYHDRTGGFIRDLPTLASELVPFGVDWNNVRDPWGHAYSVSFDYSGSFLSVRVKSAGPDGKFEDDWNQDDFQVASASIDYFAETRARIDNAITKYFQKTGMFPQNSDQLHEALVASSFNLDALRDPWGHPYYATFAQRSRYSDRNTVQTYAEYLDGHKPQVVVEPVTQQLNWIFLRSAGPDGAQGTQDDFDIASFARVVAEEGVNDRTPVANTNQLPLAGSTGAISGTVTDPTGAVIAGAKIMATNQSSGSQFTEYAGPDGAYLLRNLPAGYYKVECSETGFNTFSIVSVPVRSSSVTKIDVALQVGAVTEEVMVEASAVTVETSSSQVALPTSSATVSLTTQISTPRLREYFPETLLWRPEVITDDKGRARVHFPLADNITTWKLHAIASTLDGETATAQKNITAFQPFFVEHDPPSILTVGDEIALPVVLRNYLDRKLDLNVTMKPAPWFAPLTAAALKTSVSPDDSATDIFQFRATQATKAGKQEISAMGAGADDAISKSIAVHPNGQEKTVSESEVFGDSLTMDLALPEDAIPGSAATTLKIYPNLNAHVLESIEAILERPYGCAEQTISSAYPGILYLKYVKGTPDENSAIAARALRYAQLAYQRLLSHRADKGGFSYWGGKDAPDLALTAYSIQFLIDASKFTSVDPGVIGNALQWLLSQAKPDGHWASYDWQGNENPQQSMLLTDFIARTLVESGLTTAGPNIDEKSAEAAFAIIKKTLAHQWLDSDAANEPYALASYALTVRALGDAKAFAVTLDQLRKLEHREGDTSYWSLDTNTPFYGWGTPGRIETTALALQALAKANDPRDNDLISRGLLFLIKNQDRYGIWYTTQATIGVLNAMASLTSIKDVAMPVVVNAAAQSKAEIFVDGAAALSIDLPAQNKIVAPVTVDLTKFIAPGKHTIEIRRAAGSARASVQVLADYYAPWGADASTNDTDYHHEDKTSDALRLTVTYDKHSAKVGDTIECSVDAERIAFRGYGMLLAEIGLPPGADVDRASLDDAMKAAGWTIGEYDVLPDRVVLYLWPRAGGTKFSFKFKARFGMKALSAPSSLYDYYNPQAQAVVAPTLFTVQ